MTPQELPTQLKTLQNNDRAVSPVIGVILMVAVTVILAAIIGVYVLGFGITDPAPTVETTIEYPSSGDATIRLDSTSNSDKPVTIVANGARYGNLSNAGDTVNVYGLSEGDTIRVVYYGDSASHTVQEFTYDYANSDSSSVNFTCDPSAGKLTVKKSATSSDCAYSSIQNAVNNASNGDTIQVYDGTYNENTLTIDKELTIVGESKTGVVITSNTPQDCGYYRGDGTCNVHLSNTGNEIIIKQVTIDSTGTVVGVFGSGQNARIENTVLKNANELNADLIGSNWTVTSTTSKNAGLFFSSPATVTGNTITNGTVTVRAGSTVTNNQISPSDSSYRAAIRIPSGTGSTLVEDNTINGGWYAVNVGVDDVTVRNNNMEGFDNGGVRVTGNNTLIEYNTITSGAGSTISIGTFDFDTTDNFGSTAEVTGTTIQNNVLTNTRQGVTVGQYANTSDDQAAGDVTSTTITNNVMYSIEYSDVVDEDTGDPTPGDVVNAQQNYWGHNDGDNTNSDCTPASTRLRGDVDASNALCTAPDAGAGGN